MLAAAGVITAALFADAEPANARDSMFRLLRTWWFSHTNSWTGGTVWPTDGAGSAASKGPGYLPPATARLGSTTPNPAFTVPRSVIKNTTYTFYCGPGTFPCYPGYPVSGGGYSYWNLRGDFGPNNPYAPTTTTTIRRRTVDDGWPGDIHTCPLTTQGDPYRKFASCSPTNHYTQVTPTTTFGGRYTASRGGSIMIHPGKNRFGGTMRYFTGPNDFFVQSITLEDQVTKVYYFAPPTSQQVSTDVPFTLGSVEFAGSSVRERFTNPDHLRRQIIGSTSPGGAVCSPIRGTGSPPTLYTVRPPTNPGCEYYIRSVNYLVTRAPYTTGMVSATEPNGNTRTIQTATGSDTRYMHSTKGLVGQISLVHPRLWHAYLAFPVSDPQKPILMSWSSSRLRKITVTFLPEPAGVAMLAAGLMTLVGLYRHRRR